MCDTKPTQPVKKEGPIAWSFSVGVAGPKLPAQREKKKGTPDG
jgi:hypothetical protein